jgi:hypothetical protein
LSQTTHPQGGPQRPGRQHPWSIGIYTGDSPLSLAPPEGVEQPVLTAADVTDVRAEFVADPFLVRRDDRWFLFFEALPVETRRGVIGLAESPDGLHWEYRRVVLSEPFHLSYPHVFEWDNVYYMTPESLGPGQVRLYAATRFPDRWEHVACLIPGRHADPTVFRTEEGWFLMTSNPDDSASLRLYHAGSLTGPWSEHPGSPVVARESRFARPAGRIVAWDGGLIRFTQDCSRYYGREVHAFRVTHLSATDYREELAAPGPVVGPGRCAWNRWGMHHVDAHPHPGGGWIASLDAR